jgi:hypothetical protein
VTEGEDELRRWKRRRSEGRSKRRRRRRRRIRNIMSLKIKIHSLSFLPSSLSSARRREEGEHLFQKWEREPALDQITESSREGSLSPIDPPLL